LPRIGKVVTAIGQTPAELTAALKREYSVLLRNPQVIVSVHKSGLEQLQRLSGNYTVDNDGQIVVPLLGMFKTVGMNAGQVAAQVAEKAQSYFHNRIEVVASILPFSSRQLADPRLAPDGQQYFRNTVKVSPDGGLFVPDAGFFSTGNKTLGELNKEIQLAFTQFYQNEVQVHVALHESSSLNVFIGGEVRVPGTYPYRSSLTLLQLISVAGWLNDAADISEAVLLHAVEGNRYVLYKTNLLEVVNGEARMNQDLKLSPRDIVIIPKSGIAKTDLWVDQYIRRLLPFGMSVNYTVSKQRGNVNTTYP
jgi:polysaccharide export outer membrane protein